MKRRTFIKSILGFIALTFAGKFLPQQKQQASIIVDKNKKTDFNSFNDPDYRNREYWETLNETDKQWKSILENAAKG